MTVLAQLQSDGEIAMLSEQAESASLHAQANPAQANLGAAGDDNAKLPGGETIAMTAVCTILLSVILHGLSANPLVAVLEVRLKASEPQSLASD